MSDARESDFDDLAELSGMMGGATATANGTGDTPPRSTAGTSRPKSPPRSAAPRWAAGLEKKLHDTFISIGVLTSMFNEYDAMVIQTNAEMLAEKWTLLAEENPRVRRALEAMLETNAWGGAMIATAAVAIPILGNHGYIPPAVAGLFGGITPPQSDTGSAPDPLG